MTVILNIEKNKKNLNLYTAAKLAYTLTISGLAKLTGNLVASMEAVPYGRPFIEQFEIDKIKSVQQRTKVILKLRLHF